MHCTLREDVNNIKQNLFFIWCCFIIIPFIKGSLFSQVHLPSCISSFQEACSLIKLEKKVIVVLWWYFVKFSTTKNKNSRPEGCKQCLLDFGVWLWFYVSQDSVFADMMSHQGSVRGYAVLWSLLAAGAILIRQYYIVSDKSKRYGNYLLQLG